MAKRKISRGKQPKATKEPQEATAPALAETPASAEPSKPTAKKPAKSKRRPRRIIAKKAKPRAKAKPVASKKSPTRRSRLGKRYTPAERAKILSIARREGLTGAKVAERFGVSALSYYTWRKKAASAAKRIAKKPGAAAGRPQLRASAHTPDLVESVRREVRAMIARMLPGIVTSEVATALSASGGRKKSRR